MNDKVLITGIEGFTGSYAKSAIEASGFEVIGLSNSDYSLPGTIQCDLRDRDKLFNIVETVSPGAVLHLAGIASPAHENPEEFYSCNTIATVNLLDALSTKSQDLNKVIVASSSNVYGSQQGRLSESCKFQPLGHYANSKVAMEMMARNYYNQLPIVIARPFNYTGVGQSTKFVVPKIVEHFQLRQERIQLGNIDVERDFLDVRDVATAYAEMLVSEASSIELNLCSGRAVSLKHIIEYLSGLTQHTVKIEVNQAFVRPNDIPMIVGDPGQLVESTRFKAQYQIEDTLAWMLEA